jgi:hypothetical protein
MTTTEAAKKWTCDESTVRGWCQEGLIEGAKQEGNNNPWFIPENALPPYKFGRKKFDHLENRLVLILEAMSLRKTIAPKQFGYSRQDMLEEFLTLFNAKLIEEKEFQPDEAEKVQDLFRYYKLSMAGNDFLKQHKGFLKAVKEILSVATAVKQLIPKKL